MTIVDAHHHLWDPGAGDYPWMTGHLEPLRRPYTVRDLAPHLADDQVCATVVVQARADLAETVELLTIARQTDFIAGVVGWVDLTTRAIDDQIGHLRSTPGGEFLVGLRHDATSEPDPRWLTRADVDASMRRLADHRLVFDLEITTRELDAATQLALRHPQVRFVVDHAAKPPIRAGWSTAWAEGLRRLADAPNVWCKLSGLVTEADWSDWSPGRLAPYIHHVLDVFGVERIVFGSDWPVCELAASYKQVVEVSRTCLSDLEPPELDAVLHRNALACYGLTLPRSPR